MKKNKKKKTSNVFFSIDLDIHQSNTKYENDGQPLSNKIMTRKESHLGLHWHIFFFALFLLSEGITADVLKSWKMKAVLKGEFLYTFSRKITAISL